MPRVGALTIYPVKSLDGMSVESATVAGHGGLAADRRWRLTDRDGKVVNGKRSPAIHRLRARFDLAAPAVELSTGGPWASFSLTDPAPLEAWLGEQLGLPIRLESAGGGSFPDDSACYGPTVLGAGTMARLGEWFPSLEADEVWRRFRANIRLDDTEPFWEDRLFGEPGTKVLFRIGEVTVEGIQPCKRCAVPTRDSATGEADPGFHRAFADRRLAELPAWAAASRFEFPYRLAVNTRIPATEAGKRIAVGDPVEIIGIEAED